MNVTQLVKKMTTWGLESFGLFYGTYPGMVDDVNDPELKGRVRVKCNYLWGKDAPEIWCYPKYGPVHNEGGGLRWPLKPGDPVWIECRHGNPEYPVYSGGWWKKGAFGNNLELRGLETPSGWKLHFDDLAGTMKLLSPAGDMGVEVDTNSRELVAKAGGAQAIFNDLSGVEVVDATGNKVELSVMGAEVSSAGGAAVLLMGVNIFLNNGVLPIARLTDMVPTGIGPMAITGPGNPTVLG